ncbi:MAG: hypothetical protein M3Q42_15355 [Pseudomonadota bacterium]|nr:hypothetical protein [Pseudomonadota bacterium]
MKKTIEQIRQEGEQARKSLKSKEDRALLRFAKAVLQSATFKSAQLPESEILRVVSEAAGRLALVETPTAQRTDHDLRL